MATALPDTEMARLLGKIEHGGLQLEGVSTVAIAVMQLADDPTATGADLVKLIEPDPALSARLLRVANSAYYGQRSPMSSIDASIQRMGFAAIRNIAVAASFTRAFRPSADLGAFDPRELWTHSVAVGVAARLIATSGGAADPNEAFLAGALHDIGILVGLQHARRQFIATLTTLEQNPSVTFRDAELINFGGTHDALGAALCAAWRFPHALQQVCALHHDPERAHESARSLVTLVHAADVLAARAGLGYSRTVEQLEISPAHCEFLHVTSADLSALQSTLPQHVANAMQQLGPD